MPDGLVKLPEPGGYIPSDARPCGCCGEVAFIVVRAVRRYRAEDGGEVRREVVDVRCGRCPQLTDPRDDYRVTIGSFDTRSGTLTITPGA